MTVSGYFIFLYSLFSNIEFYFEENKFIMLASIIGAVVNIALNAIFMPLFGYIAAGYTTLVCYMLFALAHYLFMRKTCRKHIEGRQIYNIRVVCFTSSMLLIFSAIIMALYNFTLIRYGLLFSIFLAVIIQRKKLISVLRQLQKQE